MTQSTESSTRPWKICAGISVALYLPLTALIVFCCLAQLMERNFITRHPIGTLWCLFALLFVLLSATAVLMTLVTLLSNAPLKHRRTRKLLLFSFIGIPIFLLLGFLTTGESIRVSPHSYDPLVHAILGTAFPILTGGLCALSALALRHGMRSPSP